MNSRWICLRLHFALHFGHRLWVWTHFRRHGSQKPCPQNVVHIWFKGNSSKQTGHRMRCGSRTAGCVCFGLDGAAVGWLWVSVCVRLRRVDFSGVSVSDAHRSTTAVIRCRPGVSPTKITSSSSWLRFGIYSSTSIILSAFEWQNNNKNIKIDYMIRRNNLFYASELHVPSIWFIKLLFAVSWGVLALLVWLPLGTQPSMLPISRWCRSFGSGRSITANNASSTFTATFVAGGIASVAVVWNLIAQKKNHKNSMLQ